ncbi:MAG: trypsin-like serine protease, partial [Dehalococcoidia bacterium]
LIVLGWGTSNADPETGSAVLKQKTVSVYLDSVCGLWLRSGKNAFSPSLFRPTENLVCTGPDGIGARLTSWWLIARRAGSSNVGSVCPGDSGGPLVRRIPGGNQLAGVEELVGVISLTATCGPRRANFYEAEVDVFQFKPWILETTQED